MLSRLPARETWLILALTGVCAGPSRSAGAEVFTPELARALMSVLAEPPLGFPARCGLRQVQAEREHAFALFGCEKGVTVKLKLSERTSVPAATATTAQFAVELVSGVPPTGFMAALLRRIKETETTWRWALPGAGTGSATSEVHVPARSTSGRAAPPAGGPSRDTPSLDGAHGPRGGRETSPVDRFGEAAGLLLRRGRHQEALVLYVLMARARPADDQVKSRIVAAVAPTLEGEGSTAMYVAAAVARPQDPLAQFVAGVVSFLVGQHGAASGARKRSLYQTALVHLERALAAFPTNARLRAYVALAHHRTGGALDAKALIDEAVRRDERDPEAYLARAEIVQLKDVGAAIRDVETYLSRTGGGRAISARKLATVQAILGQLRAIAAGTAAGPVALFDPPLAGISSRSPDIRGTAPIAGPSASSGAFAPGSAASPRPVASGYGTGLPPIASPSPRVVGRSPATIAVIGLVCGLGGVLLWFCIARLRRRRPPSA